MSEYLLVEKPFLDQLATLGWQVAPRCLAALCFSLVTLCANAGVTESLVYTRYPADASAARSLLGALNAASPIRENGQIFHAYTRWQVDWRFRWNEKPDGRCRITSVSTRLSGTIQLPALTGGRAALRERFETYLAALRVHELGHFQIGRDAAEAIDRKILALDEMPGCAALEAEANAQAHRTLEEFLRRERDYDVRTTHGKTQGAWLEE